MGKWTRRAVVGVGSVAGGALLLGAGFVALAPNRLATRPDDDDAAAGTASLTTWVKLTEDGDVIAIVPHAEMGQGAQTALAMLLAEELDADWSRVRVEAAPALGEYANGHVLRAFVPGAGALPSVLERAFEYGAYRMTRLMDLQVTGGSASVRGTGWHGMRIAGAAAREMLLAAAAQRWDVPGDQLEARASRVTHAASGRSAGYGELAAAAARLDPPVHPRLKDPAQYTIVGTPRPRFDIPSKVDGSARYAVDVRLPGMLCAAVRAAPVPGARVERADTAAAEHMPGVVRVVQLPDAVAVVARTHWQAQQALAAVEVRFSSGPAAKFDSAAWQAQQEQALQAAQQAQGGEPDLVHGDAPKALAAARTRVTAQYHVPFLHHATMEPMSTTVRIADGRCDVYTGVQDPLNARRVVAKALDVDAATVTVHNQQLGGGFGRRLIGQYDYVEQAARIARECAPAPVQLLWSREEDTRHGYYRPAVAASFAGAVDASGQLLAWQNVYSGTKEGSAAHPPYAVAHVDIRRLPMDSGVREGPWRSVAHSWQGFFVESFTDELAVAAGRDPLDFRHALLAQRPRHRAVLARVAQMSGWSPATRREVDAVSGLRRGLGVALVESFGSIVAEVCEVAVDAAGALRVERVWAAVDCGIVVNPDTAQAQVEGGILMGLSAALGERISFAAGAVEQGNFHDYALLRFNEAPRVEVQFIASQEAPGGLGEPGTPPIAAALANAVFAATGQRVRALPLRPALLPATATARG